MINSTYSGCYQECYSHGNDSRYYDMRFIGSSAYFIEKSIYNSSRNIKVDDITKNSSMPNSLIILKFYLRTTKLHAFIWNPKYAILYPAISRIHYFYEFVTVTNIFSIAFSKLKFNMKTCLLIIIILPFWGRAKTFYFKFLSFYLLKFRFILFDTVLLWTKRWFIFKASAFDIIYFKIPISTWNIPIRWFRYVDNIVFLISWKKMRKISTF